ncbi:MAG TPA: ABC transporter permease [Candidatus Dormibacteraeota bacterium]|nr:ABC transporter permease [Candidatus Dormibacteraeota bacterium]
MSWVRSYGLLLRWQTLRLKGFLPFAVVVQGLFAFGIVAGYPLLFPQLDRTTILYLATGAPAITLLSMGLVAVPQLVAQARTEGTLDYMRSLPIPRVVYLLADLTVWLVIVVPGVVFAIVVAAVRFGLQLEVSPLVVPAMALVVLTASSVGYALATLLPPMVAQLLTQVLVVFILMFSPLNFPADRLPSWLAAIHSVLPVEAMGEIIRGTLAGNVFPLSAGAFALVAAWCAASFAVTMVVLERRR